MGRVRFGKQGGRNSEENGSLAFNASFREWSGYAPLSPEQAGVQA